MEAEQPWVESAPRTASFSAARAGRSWLRTAMDGFLREQPGTGLFVHQTRMLSGYRLLINGQEPEPVVCSNVQQQTWIGYYIAIPPGAPPMSTEGASQGMRQEVMQTLEVVLSRRVGEGLHEDIDLRNFSQHRVSFCLEVEIGADFRDQSVASPEGPRPGRLRSEWRPGSDGDDLVFDYSAAHRFSHPGEKGTARTQRSLTVSIQKADSPPVYRRRKGLHRLIFEVDLPPGSAWHACLLFAPIVDGESLAPVSSCRTLTGIHSNYDILRERVLDTATAFRLPDRADMASNVVEALEQAKSDLASLRLYDLDRGHDVWTMAAGLPSYIALFGRDVLTAAWQAGLATPGAMIGTLRVLAEEQGRQENPWRDEEPGRMLHEAHTGPLKKLNYQPTGRSFSSATTAGLYPFVLAECWHWTGDRKAVGPLVEPALRAMQWLDEYTRDDAGFYYYLTKSPMGARHQAWKDSPDAIVDGEGRQVDPPLATCEEQGFAYASKLFLAEVLWSLGRKGEAKRLRHEASELKDRFNDAFWMDREGFLAMALKKGGQQVRSIGSNAGHCVATGIIDDSRILSVVNRLFEDDLFSGWGIRTLSADNPAYNPYSYYRGSVWPVEHGTFALGFMRYGLHDAVQRLAKAQFEAAALFDFRRLPEAISGHPRSKRYPIPAIYPDANSPQAWSSSSLFLLVQSLLGLYPYAPRGTTRAGPAPSGMAARANPGTAEGWKGKGQPPLLPEAGRFLQL